MATDRRWYCSSCGTRITEKEFRYLECAIRAGEPRPCLSNADCEGTDQ